jgi:hypothetical protein
LIQTFVFFFHIRRLMKEVANGSTNKKPPTI